LRTIVWHAHVRPRCEQCYGTESGPVSEALVAGLTRNHQRGLSRAESGTESAVHGGEKPCPSKLEPTTCAPIKQPGTSSVSLHARVLEKGDSHQRRRDNSQEGAFRGSYEKAKGEKGGTEKKKNSPFPHRNRLGTRFGFTAKNVWGDAGGNCQKLALSIRVQVEQCCGCRGATRLTQKAGVRMTCLLPARMLSVGLHDFSHHTKGEFREKPTKSAPPPQPRHRTMEESVTKNDNPCPRDHRGQKAVSSKCTTEWPPKRTSEKKPA